MGNCGNHYTTVTQNGPHRVTASSGFALNSTTGKAFDITWQLTLNDGNGMSKTPPKEVNPDFPVATWNWSWPNLNQYRYSKVKVTAPKSEVITTTGYVCWGSGAESFITIT